MTELDFSKNRGKMGIKEIDYIHITSISLTQTNENKIKQFFQNWWQWHAMFTSKIQRGGCFLLSLPFSFLEWDDSNNNNI